MKWILLCLYFSTSLSWGQTVPSSRFTVNNKASLQHGAAVFMNYCSGCHALQYVRYDQMAMGLGIDSAVVLKNNLIFTQVSSTEPIEIALPSEDAQQWFGLVPPDLSLITRQKSASWLYQYLMGFYKDENRPFGVNNTVVPNVAMPDVLEALRGEQWLPTKNHQSLVKRLNAEVDGDKNLERTVTDLVCFLAYVGEPSQIMRYKLGPYVLIFLCFLFIPVYCLKRMYWNKEK